MHQISDASSMGIEIRFSDKSFAKAMCLYSIYYTP